MRKRKPEKLTLTALLENNELLRELRECEAAANNTSLDLVERKKYRARIKSIFTALIPDLRRSRQGINYTLDLFVRYEEIKEELKLKFKREYRNPLAHKLLIKEILEKWSKCKLSEKELGGFISYRRQDELAARIAVYGVKPKISFHTLLAGYKKMQRSLKTIRPTIEDFVSRMKKIKTLKNAL